MPLTPACEATSLWWSEQLQLLQFLPGAISYKQSLLWPPSCLLFFKSSRLIFVFYFALFIIQHSPFLCWHSAILLSGSHFPSRSCSSPIPDRTMLWDVRIGRDYFCSIAQDKTKTPHNAHLRVPSMLTGLTQGWGPESYKCLCQAIEPLCPKFSVVMQTARLKEITLRVDMMPANTFLR